MTSTQTAGTRTVRTGLFIGGEERSTADVLQVADPAKPGVVVGEASHDGLRGLAARHFSE